ncbi:LuxR family maltose regulon positive regulatory protein [Nocardioides daedukensis]|uniref:LuxR family maltose regulon positive regulatory protein n=1 Tax=Nocardioides daedukensis TaxID=634462 RepID=A0A7Y9S5G4_9ACTN|nr:LuxR C-terminal-related transcriptional regulator [Nocardioides daedukensis]NYG59780.1 LuxR family maltose regulon positive regulatory protein [Nocardioides daedukensis]
MLSVSWRDRLLRAIDTAAPLLILRGPSGFGKSGLLREWVASLDESHHVVWVSFGPDPVPAGEFWIEAIAAAQQAGILPAHNANAMSNAAAAGLLDLQSLAARLTAGRNCVLAIDGYQATRPDHEVLDEQLVELAVSHPRLRIAVTTRSSTQFTSDRALLSGVITEISPAQLAYTLEETRLAVGGDEAAERLHAETGGYPLAVQAASALAGRPWPAATTKEVRHRMVAVSLETELWKLTDPAFVALTCLPPFFDSTLAESITALTVEEVGQVLDDLEWHGFGQSHVLPDGSRTFAYVETLRQSIRQRTLAELGEASLQRVGAPTVTWLRSHDPASAFTLALELELYDEAAAAYGWLLATDPGLCTGEDLHDVLSAIPPEVSVAQPVLAFARGIALISDPSLAEAAPAFLSRAAAPATRELPERMTEAELVELSMATIALRLLKRYPEAGRAAHHAVTLMRTAPDDARSGNSVLTLMLLRQLLFTLAQAGDFDAVQATIAWAMSVTSGAQARSDLMVGMVALDAISGRVAQARELAKRNPARPPELDQDDTPFLMELRSSGHVTLDIESFDFVSARAAVKEIPTALAGELRPFHDWILMHAALAGGNGRAEATRILEETKLLCRPAEHAQSWADAVLINVLAIGLLSGGDHTLVRELFALPTPFPGQVAPATLLALVLTGDSRTALERLPELREAEGHTLRSLTALKTVAAAAALREQDREQAEVLLRNLDHAYHQHGLQLPLLYLPAHDLDGLIEEGRRLGLVSWTAFHGKTIPSPRFVTSRVARLTEREQAVAEALLTHTNRHQIAKALFVSENTIKTQMRSIYRKLGVTNRREAIDRIVELRLVPGVESRSPS